MDARKGRKTSKTDSPGVGRALKRHAAKRTCADAADWPEGGRRYIARVRNEAGMRSVCYGDTEPRVGAECPGVAAPNRITGYWIEHAPSCCFCGKSDGAVEIAATGAPMHRRCLELAGLANIELLPSPVICGHLREKREHHAG